MNSLKEIIVKFLNFLLSHLHYYYQQSLRRTLVRSVRYSAFKKQHSYLLIAYCLFIFFISSCKVGKEYQRPVLELPKQFDNVSFSDTSNIANIEWKNFFTDKTLQELIQKGITYNHDLLYAMKRIDISQEQLKQARLLQFPELNSQMTAQYTYPSKNSLNGLSTNSFLGKSHIENYQVNFNLSWEVDVWGKLRSQKEATLAEYVQTYEAAKAVQTQLVANIAQGYFNLLMLDRQLEIAKRNLSLSDSFFVATQLLKDAGLATSLAVQQASSQKQSTALLIPQLEQNIAIQENALQVLTGQLPGSVIRSALLNEILFTQDLSAGVPASIVSRRPDVRSNEMALVVANAEVGIAQANMYPALNISAGTGLESFKA